MGARRRRAPTTNHLEEVGHALQLCLTTFDIATRFKKPLTAKKGIGRGEEGGGRCEEPSDKHEEAGAKRQEAADTGVKSSPLSEVVIGVSGAVTTTKSAIVASISSCRRLLSRKPVLLQIQGSMHSRYCGESRERVVRRKVSALNMPSASMQE